MSAQTYADYAPPERSIEQRMSALEHANIIRTYRAHLKRDIKAGRKHISNVLLDPPQEIETMKIVDLLMSVPKIGRTKVNKMLKVCAMSSSKTVGGISPRQRDALLTLVRN